MERKIALVLGATGGIGGEVAQRLLADGWHVRALSRSSGRQQPATASEWIVGDAMHASDIASAAAGAELIVHAVNPPGYRDWDRLVLPMLDNSIAAANGARILLPGTVYNYGPDAFPSISEDAPQHPLTRKGRIRVEMERRLEEAARAGQARALIVRAGDFFGPRAGNSWFSQGLVAPGGRPGKIQNPARRGIGHQWAYLPDVAETMVRLLALETLDDFARFHMDGHWDVDGTQMVGAIQCALGAPSVSIKPMPWWAMRLAAPFVPLLRELLEMRYLWEEPVRLDDSRLRAALGEEPRTPLDVAVRTTLAAMGSLPA
ncbi:hypothetical protein CA223_02810 [Sphingomonas koreensis]|jgi:nucleoside-diphosphate-sugar epimerase|uniref:NAD-dependent epimerase/dehydratase family protein n=1 Tax=Sphingomonas koreensis TaxID=93064 RepID=A0A1L6JF98_9SPHN|nr:NAD-dependent epimerase/dehydratase family protein [Sphingomonas koreensis]APR54170.1 hypothetical protein BRX40_18680 [Sphingomonas koreensis]MDC7809161.1 NAD(P)H-binding protein [Sphingomonas koreensis]RSU18807.1 hypothetical protein CA224_15415 [Sphingomonas koreensis]RSU25584.1 hypothetical protein CA222_12425 [Sphingomonas koreensis]RSU25682.1 hypothetical protein CA225_14570 [Sphingomonas koreensis]